MNAFRETYTELRDWLFDRALPLWSTVGVDRDRGGFFEKIDHDGRPTHDPRRTRLVARQIFSFVAAEEMGWRGPTAELVSHGLDFFHRHCVSPEGPVFSVVAADGTPIRRTFDTYDHAFALFALATSAGAGHDTERGNATALSILSAMREGWGHEVAGFYEASDRRAPLLANPHMHLFEAALEWIEATPDEPAWPRLADELGMLAIDHLCDPDTGAIVETYDAQWRPMDDPALGHPVVEPGHQLEWAWLLLRFAELRDNPRARAAGRRLIEIAETYGIADNGLCYNALDTAFRVVDADHRLWPQTERAKAGLIVCDEEMAARALTGLSAYLDTPRPGLWFETIEAQGTPAAEAAKASSLYHIICALREAHRYQSA